MIMGRKLPRNRWHTQTEPRFRFQQHSTLVVCLVIFPKDYQRISFSLRHLSQICKLSVSQKAKDSQRISLIPRLSFHMVKIQKIIGSFPKNVLSTINGASEDILEYLWNWGKNCPVPGQTMEDVLQVTSRYSPGILRYPPGIPGYLSVPERGDPQNPADDSQISLDTWRMILCGLPNLCQYPSNSFC